MRRCCGGMHRVSALETLGAASLPVFVAHLVIALVALAYLGEARTERPLSIDMALFVGSYAALYAVAWVTLELERRAAAARKRIGGWAAQRLRAGAR